MTKYKTLAIGIDQSYKNVGISISADGRLLKVKNVDLGKCKTKSEKRGVLRKKLSRLCAAVYGKAENHICVIERIRLRSQGFLNIDYIKSIGALNALIVDVFSEFGIEVYSVDTRCWKAQVVGSAKKESNKFGVPEEKWLTVQWCIAQGFEESILKKVEGRRTKGTFEKNGIKFECDNDASDSAAISMFYFKGDKSKLKIES